MSQQTDVESSRPGEHLETLGEIARRHVERVLVACGGNITHAAKVLDVSRTTVQRYIRRHKIPLDRAGHT